MLQTKGYRNCLGVRVVQASQDVGIDQRFSLVQAEVTRGSALPQIKNYKARAAAARNTWSSNTSVVADENTIKNTGCRHPPSTDGPTSGEADPFNPAWPVDGALFCLRRIASRALMQCMCDSARQMGRLGDINSHGIAWAAALLSQIGEQRMTKSVQKEVHQNT